MNVDDDDARAAGASGVSMQQQRAAYRPAKPPPRMTTSYIGASSRAFIARDAREQDARAARSKVTSTTKTREPHSAAPGSLYAALPLIMRGMARLALAGALASLGIERAVSWMLGTVVAFALPTLELEDDASDKSKRTRERRTAARRELERTSLGRVEVRFGDLRVRALADELDSCAFYAWTLASACAARGVERAAAALASREEPPTDGITPTLGFLGVVVAMRALWCAHVDVRVTPSSERRVALFFTFVAWCVSVLFTLLTPQRAIDLRLESTAVRLNDVLVERLSMNARVTALTVGLVYGCVGAALGGLTVASTTRSVKSYNILTSGIPDWARAYAGSSAIPSWRKLVAHTALASPMLCVVIRSPAMFQDAFMLSESEVRDVQCGALVLAGLAMFASVNTLTQAHLDSGLITWYEVKEGTRDGQLNKRAADVVTQKLDLTNHVVCKVALQAAAPALLILSCGVGAWTTSDDVLVELFLVSGWFACAWSVVVGAAAVLASQPLFIAR